MRRAAPRPPSPCVGRDDDGPALDVGVDGGGGGAGDVPGGPAGQGQQDGLGQELDPDLAFRGAQRAAQPDFLAALQHRDDHDVGHADRADQQRDRAQAEEQGVERAGGVGLRRQRLRRLGDVDLVRVLRVGLRGEQVVNPGGGGRGVDGADVKLGGMPVEAEVGLRGGEADQDGGVDLRGEGGGVEDAREVEPLAADPDPLAGPDPVDAHQLGGLRAEHGDRLFGGGGVEVAALGDRGARHGGQAQAGGVHAEPVGVDRGDQRAAVGSRR